MSSYSPIKKKSFSASEIDLSDDDLGSVPEYHPIAIRPRVVRIHDRDGLKEIAQIVGSKRFRDIKRSGNFMPGQFQLWNEKENGGNRKYWGGYEDVDEDGYAHEFVVRRGDKHGPMVAINGYTTKQSDWGARKAFYEAYPARWQRKGKTAKNYMRDEYYVPEYDQYGNIDKWAIKPESEQDALKEWTMYNNYTPKKLSPYQAFQKYIVTPVLNNLLEENNVTKAEFRGTFGPGVILYTASLVYQSLVKNVIYAKLSKTQMLAKLEAEFITKKQIRNPDYNASDANFSDEFFNYLFTRKDVKAMTAEYVHHILSNPAAKFEAAKGVIVANIDLNEVKKYKMRKAQGLNSGDASI